MQFVYVLFHPITDVIAYVGITDNPYRRYGDHCRVKINDDSPKAAWIRGLKEKNLRPSMKIVECVEVDEYARDRELYWIQHYLNLGIKLVNVVNNHPLPSPKPSLSKPPLPKKVIHLGDLIQEAIARKIERAGLKKYSIRQLAGDANTSEPHLSRIVRGQSQPSRELLLKICRALECTMEEAAKIFAESDWRKPTLEELSAVA
jgi:DNA-binding Xre family transcriptional regulator